MENKHEHIESLRKDYHLKTLNENEVFEDPIRQFQKWFKEAEEANVDEPNIMVLSTSDSENRPSSRVLLLKGVDEEGFRFYTNYESEKGQTIAENPQVSLMFLWYKTQQQVRIKGTAYKLSPEDSERYFQSRPKNSQIGAWASPQSQVIENRDVLENKVAEITEKYADQEVLPKPPHWGGYIVKPYQIEFWQGRPSRLHDRLRYTLTELNPKKWTLERLAP